jgi:elongation factor Ts
MLLHSKRFLLTPSRTSFSLRSSFSTAITASMVKELREVTGAPMMECKKALSDPEVNGNIQKGVDWLRAKGIAKATSQTTRKSIEGLIGIYQPSSSARGISLVEVNSETDFVSRNNDFQKFVTSVILTSNLSSVVAADGIDVEKVLELQSVVGNEQTMTLKHILGDITSSIRSSSTSVRRSSPPPGRGLC